MVLNGKAENLNTLKTSSRLDCLFGNTLPTEEYNRFKVQYNSESTWPIPWSLQSMEEEKDLEKVAELEAVRKLEFRKNELGSAVTNEDTPIRPGKENPTFPSGKHQANELTTNGINVPNEKENGEDIGACLLADFCRIKKHIPIEKAETEPDSEFLKLIEDERTASKELYRKCEREEIVM